MPTNVNGNFFWSNKRGKFLTLIFTIGILSAIVGGIAIYKQALTSNQKTTETTPSSTPSVEIPLNQYTLRILNGSGTAGVAVNMKKVLVDKGYQVVEIGNADTKHEETLIEGKVSVNKSFLSDLKNIMATYSANIKEDTLQNSESVDIQIILGSPKQQ